jgi:uncharacterized protein (DUF1501 family)
MKRRDFLKIGSMATVACSINGLPLKAFGKEASSKQTRNLYTNGKKLVMIRMSGGNDGLNTLIPLDKYAELTASRANVLIPANQVLPLNGVPTNGLHPSMVGMKNLFDTGKLNILQGVSYPNPDFSHFRASDIFSSGSDSNLYLNSGWIGRMIENQFPGAPLGYPTSFVPDPFSIEIGYSSSQIIYGNNGLNGMSVSNIDYFYNIQNSTVDPAPNTKGGHELEYVRFVTQQTQSYTTRIEAATLAGTNSISYPTNNYLADQLKIVAKLISGGLNTPVYIVTIDGFDTHDSQVDTADHSIGEHANLLSKLSSAISAFQLDIETQNLDNQVVGMTFSEFGRRIKSNASNGTDHGSGAPMFVFGTSVNPAMLGTSPVLPASATEDDNVPMQHDFRQVYSTMLTDWFGINGSNVNSIMNGNNYAWLPIFQASSPLPISMLGLQAKASKCEVSLNWETEHEENFSHFNVMYSKDGNDFEKIGRIETKGTASAYDFKHEPSEGMAFYYLQAIDIDQKSLQSNTVTLRVSCEEVKVLVYPNPATDFIHVDIKGAREPLSITLLNQGGQMMTNKMSQNDRVILNTRNMPNGLYSLVITNSALQKEIHQIAIKH